MKRIDNEDTRLRKAPNNKLITCLRKVGSSHAIWLALMQRLGDVFISLKEFHRRDLG